MYLLGKRHKYYVTSRTLLYIVPALPVHHILVLLNNRRALIRLAHISLFFPFSSVSRVVPPAYFYFHLA